MKTKYTPKTKIICTLGPSTKSKSMILHLVKSGMDAVRLNFSHGNYAEHKIFIRNLREVEKKTKQHIAIIQDLQGPKIRIGKLINEPLKVTANSTIVLTTEKSEDKNFIPVDYNKLHREVKRGDKIFIDDGKIRIQVEKVVDKKIICRALNSGEINSHKGINLPGVKISIPAITDKDKRDILFGLENGVDYIALSFVRSADDVEALRMFIMKSKSNLKTPFIIAKIEKQEALDELDKIIEISDGILIARGDLGIEIPIESVPLIQKEIIRKCRAKAKPVIVATQMLESMIKNPLPTRAEVSDVANSVIDGSDAVLLSGETAVGKFPVEAVNMMNKIIFAVEQNYLDFKLQRFEDKNDYDALAESAVMLADQIGANAIVAITYSGRTAIYLSKYRPKAHIFAFTEFNHTARKLSVSWGIESFVMPAIKSSTDSSFDKIHKQIISKKILKKGDKYVVLAGLPFFEKNLLNTIKIFTV